MKKSTNHLRRILPIIIIFSTSTLVIGSIFNCNVFQLQNSVAIEAIKNNHANNTINTTNTTNTAITNSATSKMNHLSVKEVTSGVYKWINASNTAAENPTIKVFTNTNNTINIQNPTDTKHELILDTGKDVLPSSDDISPSSSGHISFNLNTTGTFTYHCAYHPYTMKGTIEVVNK